MPVADKIAAVEAAAADLRAREHDLEQARERFRRALTDAHKAGVSYGQLGRIVGLSRQRVASIVSSVGD